MNDDVMRKQYRELSPQEKNDMKLLKQQGADLHDFLSELGGSREIALAKTKLEESVMWAVKHITG